MLSLKATLKAIGETLDGKATKYTGYGTPVTLTTNWYTIPSDGIIVISLGYAGTYCYVTVKNADGSQSVEVRGLPADVVGYSFTICPTFKGQRTAITASSENWARGNSYARFYPFV